MRRDTKPTPEKYCAYCGVKMERKQYKSKIEDLGSFKRRKYCSWECMCKDHVCKDSTEQSWKAAHATARRIVHLIEQREVVCSQCGSTENIDIHHRDGIAQNNSSENLVMLCRACHMKAHSRRATQCSICGKVESHLVRGMCQRHYLRWKHHRDPLHKPWSTYKQKKSKGPIYVYSKEGEKIAEYADVRTAAKETGYARSSVTSACNTPNKTLGGYIWRYAD